MRISTPKCANMINKPNKIPQSFNISTPENGWDWKTILSEFGACPNFSGPKSEKTSGGVVDHNLGAIQGPSKSILKAEVDDAEGLRISRYKVRPKKQD